MTVTLPYPPSANRCQKATDQQVLDSYRQTGSVWETGKALGMCGQVVYRRLKKLGAHTPLRVLTNGEKKMIEHLYASGFAKGDGKLDLLSREIGRTKQFICRFAKSQGWSSVTRCQSTAARERLSVATQTRWTVRPHPRGATGMKHSEEMKAAARIRSAERWKNLTSAEREAQTRKNLVTRLTRYGTLAPQRHKVSWKQGWREVDGRRIYFRSRWEYNYALYLQLLVDQKQIRSWEHEPETFWFHGIKRGCITYLPDYRVTGNDGSVEYHEVKGWMDTRSKTKLKRMKKYHPAVTVRVIDGAWFKSNAKKLSWLPGWES